MDATATRQETRRDETEGDTILSVADAAVVFGISEGAVRKRIERGQIAARKTAGQWRIVLNATDATRRDETGYDNTTRPKTTNTAVPPDRPRAQLDAVMQEWLAPLVRQIAEQGETIGEQRERIAHLMAERDTAESERDQLRALLAASAPPGGAQITAEARDDLPNAADPPPSRSWWHRLWHGPSGLPA